MSTKLSESGSEAKLRSLHNIYSDAKKNQQTVERATLDTLRTGTNRKSVGRRRSYA